MEKVRFVCMHKKEKKLMMQEEEKGLARAVSLDRQEGLGSSVQRETSSTAREGKAGLMGTVIGWRGGGSGDRDQGNDPLAACFLMK